MNPNITWDIVQSNPSFGWEYYGLSSNPNITLEIVRDNPDDGWDFHSISRNKFLYDDTVCKREYEKDVEKRKKEVFPILGEVLYRDLAGLVTGFVGWD
jgi:hypothetical protein